MCRSAAALASTLSLLVVTSNAHGQACCAGSGAVTPARLALHEDALVGVTARVGGVVGNYAPDGTFTAAPAHTAEVDLEQDLLGAVRVTKRGQLAVLVPLVETYRAASGIHATGGGVGDINIGARYDFVLAGAWRAIPGIALLAGLTIPTGRTPTDAHQPLAVDATGIGAFQGNVGLALEQTWGGHWLVGLTGLLAQRATYSTEGVHESLATQFTAQGALAYSFQNEAAVGFVVAYAAEGNATLNGVTDPNSHKRALTTSLVGLLPITDALRLQGSLFLNPPVSQLGANQPSTAGLSLTLLWGFS